MKIKKINWAWLSMPISIFTNCVISSEILEFEKQAWGGGYGFLGGIDNLIAYTSRTCLGVLAFIILYNSIILIINKRKDRKK